MPSTPKPTRRSNDFFGSRQGQSTSERRRRGASIAPGPGAADERSAGIPRRIDATVETPVNAGGADLRAAVSRRADETPGSLDYTDAGEKLRAFVTPPACRRQTPDTAQCAPRTTTLELPVFSLEFTRFLRGDPQACDVTSIALARIPDQFCFPSPVQFLPRPFRAGLALLRRFSSQFPRATLHRTEGNRRNYRTCKPRPGYAPVPPRGASHR